MIKVILSAILVLSALQASASDNDGACKLSQEGDVNVMWTAYKTPEKVGVGGTFKEIGYRAASPKGKDLSAIFVGSTINIDTKSVNTKNSGRDKTLVNFFFDQMQSRTIKATLIAMEPNAADMGKTGTCSVEIRMNGVNKIVPMNYVYDADTFKADGVIDILDFSASKALTSISKACYDLHKGKTWSDVAISFSTAVTTVCSSKE
jgi:hypothetical protein